MAIIGLSFALCACSSPVPSAEIRAAGDAIARAQGDGAEQLAPQSLQMAQSKLSAAQSNVMNDNNDDARRLAEQSEVDAEYADATANAQRASNTANQLQRAQRQQMQQPPQQNP